jgi:hypothetical protein
MWGIPNFFQKKDMSRNVRYPKLTAMHPRFWTPCSIEIEKKNKELVQGLRRWKCPHNQCVTNSFREQKYSSSLCSFTACRSDNPEMKLSFYRGLISASLKIFLAVLPAAIHQPVNSGAHSVELQKMGSTPNTKMNEMICTSVQKILHEELPPKSPTHPPSGMKTHNKVSRSNQICPAQIHTSCVSCQTDPQSTDPVSTVFYTSGLWVLREHTGEDKVKKDLSTTLNMILNSWFSC